MDLLCKICYRSIIENQSEYMNYLAILRRKDGKISNKKYTINNINLDEVNKILIDYVTTHNKKLDFFY